MPRKPRQFCASMGVRFGTRRTKIELSPAEQHGGPEGQFRVRVNRRWFDAPDGSYLYFNEFGLAHLAARLAFGAESEPPAAPDIAAKTRVSVRAETEGIERHLCGWTLTPPVLALDGRWMIAVNLYDGPAFVPVADIVGVYRG